MAQSRVVFFGDLLGFGHTSTTVPDQAVDQLTRLAGLLEGKALAQFIQHPAWRERFGLSDSLFLVANRIHDAVEAAAELMFNVMFLTRNDPVLIRGGLGFGRADTVAPLFPETARSNLVGPAVVDAVKAEAEAKGPAITLAESAAVELGTDSHMLVEGKSVLWPLAWDDNEGPCPIGSLTESAIRWVLANVGNDRAEPHGQAWLRLIDRSLGLRDFGPGTLDGVDLVRLRTDAAAVENAGLELGANLTSHLRVNG